MRGRFERGACIGSTVRSPTRVPGTRSLGLSLGAAAGSGGDSRRQVARSASRGPGDRRASIESRGFLPGPSVLGPPASAPGAFSHV